MWLFDLRVFWIVSATNFSLDLTKNLGPILFRLKYLSTDSLISAVASIANSCDPLTTTWTSSSRDFSLMLYCCIYLSPHAGWSCFQCIQQWIHNPTPDVLTIPHLSIQSSQSQTGQSHTCISHTCHSHSSQSYSWQPHTCSSHTCHSHSLQSNTWQPHTCHSHTCHPHSSQSHTWQTHTCQSHHSQSHSPKSHT